MRNSKVKILCECAVLIAIGTVLAQIKLYRMPTGGSVTLASMLPFLLIGYRNGTKWGILGGLANSLLQMALGGIYAPPAGTFAALAGSILLDYVLAYLCLGFSGKFADMTGAKSRFRGLVCSAVICCFLRFICAFLSGFLIWGSIAEDGWSAVTYSLSYNGIYMIPETLLTIAVMLALYKSAPSLFARQKNL